MSISVFYYEVAIHAYTLLGERIHKGSLLYYEKGSTEILMKGNSDVGYS